jgi:urea transport system substrate-binding protein
MKNNALALLASVALLLPTASFAQDAVRLGLPIGLSGGNSVVAPGLLQAAEYAVEEINGQGGILGRQIDLVIADDASTAAGAKKAVEGLIFRDKVQGLVAVQTSAARNAVVPIASKAKVPYIYGSFYEGGSCDPYLYVDAAVPEQQVAPFVQHLAAESAKSVFLIASDYAFGRGLVEKLKAQLDSAGISVAGEEYQPMDLTDWTAVVGKVRNAAPDAIVMATAGGAPNISLTKQLRDAGIQALVANLGLDEATAGTMAGEATGHLVSSAYVSTLDTPENKAFNEGLRAKYGDETMTPSDFSVPLYDAIHLYKLAAEKAGTFDTEAVTAALAEVTFVGPRGPISMNAQHHTTLTMYLSRVQEDGSLDVLQTFDSVLPGEQCPAL